MGSALKGSGVSQETLGPDPLTVFESWFAEAHAQDPRFADAMTLATASPDGRPSARTVLYKGLSDGAVCFVSNYGSNKGQELEQNPRAALVFFWASLNRQVRLEGRVERTPAAWSDRYFAARARSSQIGAWASAQSQVIASRDVLEARLAEAEARFSDQPVPRPSFWGGYRLKPERIEFWLGQNARLHDRYSYRVSSSGWDVERLSP
ncbi:MAG: pyridoxamine 5'-phosphate oxidase [Pseudomonadota bacterium]